jgi:hypothetical protein
VGVAARGGQRRRNRVVEELRDARRTSLIDHHPLEFGIIGLGWISPGSAKALSGFH